MSLAAEILRKAALWKWHDPAEVSRRNLATSSAMDRPASVGVAGWAPGTRSIDTVSPGREFDLIDMRTAHIQSARSNGHSSLTSCLSHSLPGSRSSRECHTIAIGFAENEIGTGQVERPKRSAYRCAMRDGKVVRTGVSAAIISTARKLGPAETILSSTRASRNASSRQPNIVFRIDTTTCGVST